MFFSKFKLKPGQRAPSFSGPNQEGKTVSLEQFHGKPVLIYFYPKDDTPGCTKEACTFRDHYSQFIDRGAVVLGVSRQSVESHRKFKEKYRLPFDLISDRDGEISRAFGVPSIPLLSWTLRKSVLIDTQGKIAKVYDQVSPSKHSDQVLEDIKSLNKPESP